MSNAILSIVFTEAKSAIEGNTGSVTDRLRAAMEAVKGHWMRPPDEIKLQAAIAAVLMSYDEQSPEYSRIMKECQQLNSISAWLSAVQAGLDVKPPKSDTGFKPIGIMLLWNKIKEDRQ